MNLTGLHLLLTYLCNYECDHCFTWGSPTQKGVMTLAQVREIYRRELLMGNLFERSLTEIVAAYDPRARPIVGPLLVGGPAALVERYDLAHEEAYVDACHLCYMARESLRERFPEELGPGQMYGE